MSTNRSRLVVVALAAVVSACGPIAYINQVTRHASEAVDEARAAEADKYAPYYWTRATEYLAESRMVAGHADFQGATRFGRLAAEAAELATEAAQLAKKGGIKGGAKLAPAKDGATVAPAKDPE